MQNTTKKMHFEQDYPLKNLNTFGLQVAAAAYVAIKNELELQQLHVHPAFIEGRKLVLGGGSNMLFLNNFYDGLVIHLDNRGWSLLLEDSHHTTIRVAAGENWHSLVLQSVNMGLGGLENLSMIPGKTGAAPMQNIGAYGVELKDVFVGLRAFDLQQGKVINFDAQSCGFGYRTSVFKTSLRNRFIIISVDLRLDKQHRLNLDYGSIRDELKAMDIKKPGIKEVSDAVCRIRSSKLPDPEQLGNAGSFFKNPVIETTHFEKLRQMYPEIVAFPDAVGKVKLAAGWLIEKAGWKGMRQGDAAVHDKQALVIVNHGKATGRELFALAMEVKAAVEQRFAVSLEPEVNIID